MLISVLDADTLGADLDLTPLSACGVVHRFSETAPDDIISHIGDSDVIVINKLKMTAAVLEQCPRLRLICVFATGFDNVDVAYCRAHHIAVCNVVGYSTDSVAQLTIAIALSLVIHLPAYTNYVNNGSYSAGTVANRLVPPYHEIAGMTWGVVGNGHIGQAVGRIAKAMGCRVIAFRKHPTTAEETDNLQEVCRQADILSVHLPLNGDTRGIIGKEEISLIKPSAVIINMARGAVIDESAVADAVLNGRLAGFGSDVYSVEPFGTDHPFYPLLGRDNVCLTPHMAWGSLEARQRCLSEIIRNIQAFVSGEVRCRVD